MYIACGKEWVTSYSYIRGQVGSLPLHVPLNWQVLVDSPSSWYPVLQVLMHTYQPYRIFWEYTGKHFIIPVYRKSRKIYRNLAFVCELQVLSCTGHCPSDIGLSQLRRGVIIYMYAIRRCGHGLKGCQHFCLDFDWFVAVRQTKSATHVTLSSST